MAKLYGVRRRYPQAVKRRRQSKALGLVEGEGFLEGIAPRPMFEECEAVSLWFEEYRPCRPAIVTSWCWFQCHQ
jgi:hypothetical protein